MFAKRYAAGSLKPSAAFALNSVNETLIKSAFH